MPDVVLREINPMQLLAVVVQCLEAAGHDLRRAMELAAAEILVLRTHSSAGYRRSMAQMIAFDDVPALLWSTEALLQEQDTKGIEG